MYMTPQAYAAYFNLHINTVYRLLRYKKIQGAQQIGKSWRINVKTEQN